MNEWPTGWFREDKPAAPQDGNAMPGAAAGSAAAGSAATGRASGMPGGANDPTVRLPAGSGAAGSGAGGSGYGAGGSSYGPGGSGYASTATGVPANPWPNQPPVRSAPGRPPRGPRTYSGGRRPRRPRLRLLLAFLAGLVVVLLILVIGGYFYLDGKLNRSNVLASYAGQPAAGAGSNWLITGSDSRQGLTRKQERKYHTGIDIGGQRSDTILLLHIPGNGGPAVLVSLPRDSYVKIPGYGWNKLNAAYSFGGPKLLAQTVQNATGLRIEHYMGIGFGGLVNVVNSVGGVTMCFKHSLHDAASGVHLKKGCQTLSGGQALSFVRVRHTFASQDLQREQNQRVFIKALLSKLTSPGVMFNPFSVVPAALGSVNSLSVDDGTHLNQLVSVAFALRQPKTTTVPIGNSNLATAAGDAVQWDSAQAGRLFHDLNTDTPLPKRLLTGSHLQG
ncbi:MAG TPA: LCP family protein [Streptosporangiaceae bacterium]|nr:LCP family protein [Streptosporangiaceae bacterium]